MPKAVLVLSLLFAGCTGSASTPAADRQSPAPTPAAPANVEPALPPGHPPIGGDASLSPHAGLAAGGADVGDVTVEKAPGKDGRTVAEIHASKAALKGAEVAVRGKVVKWNAGILGRNWMHLQDGSGSAEKQDHDLAVTTSETVAKGDVVLVRGTLALDQDFGAGYVYPVILENAKLVK